ncbi:alpha-glucoside transport system permease protein [Pseudonocardia hierapolitana]|uniref:Alpha-glucoside transport system permease protein n=1 Tax=Pseudonocardia hierapolitana TaxID=1128676 RepID=A0A561SX14_9PSEU|nr:ABC transporter permease subunit [Pseudonocardia hierapolitana]TWF79408.1 alpha-glucoside transport system permease protein [Pseudonocardia hierapolitana]
MTAEPTGPLSGGSPRIAALFLTPALLLVIVFLVYPTAYSLVRSFFDARGTEFVGVENYVTAFTDDRTLVALRNSVIWVLVAPTLVTTIGLILAVLTEKIRWATAFRLVMFMPLAISLVASGIIFRLVYEEDPDRGVVNAAVVSVHDVFTPASPYSGARPREGGGLVGAPDGALVTSGRVGASSAVGLPITGFDPVDLPARAAAAVRPEPGTGLRGLVWLDVGGTPDRTGEVDAGERGMPGITVEVLEGDRVVATATTGDNGRFTVPDLPGGPYTVRLPAANFAEPFRGLTWLGPVLVTPVVISAWLWIMSGFAMTLIAAGLASIPRDALEAARVDGATEWQVFRRVTVPLLSPVLLVVFVTLVINVLKVFDLVFVIAPGSVQEEANVLALQVWQVSFGAGGGDQGLGSALAVLLFLLVLPAMAFNIRRFRGDRS